MPSILKTLLSFFLHTKMLRNKCKTPYNKRTWAARKSFPFPLYPLESINVSCFEPPGESLLIPFSMGCYAFFMPQTTLFNYFLHDFIASFISHRLSIAICVCPRSIPNSLAKQKSNFFSRNVVKAGTIKVPLEKLWGITNRTRKCW